MLQDLLTGELKIAGLNITLFIFEGRIRDKTIRVDKRQALRNIVAVIIGRSLSKRRSF